MARGEVILRQWNLLKALQTRGEGIPLKNLASQFDVSERTIQRDFEILQELGFPIAHEEDDYGKRFWRMPHDFFRTGPFVLSLTEAVSLLLAERVLTPLAGTYLAEGLLTVLEKIRSQVPQRALDYFSELDETIHVRRMGAADYSEHADTIRTLVDAARAEKTVEVSYRAIWRGAEYTTAFDPYGLIYYDGDLFTIGRSHRADDVRMLKVTRILEAQGTDRGFTRPVDFRLEDEFRTSFGILRSGSEPVEVTVRFTGATAALVAERVWHESQQLTWLPAEETLFEQPSDELDTLMARYRLSGVAEFKRWIKGFGEQAEVLNPAWLRAELYAELRDAAERHAP